MTKQELQKLIRESITKQLSEQQSKWHRDELSDLGKTKFRVNYGNGQVSNLFTTRARAEHERELGDYPKGFIEFKDLDTGEWLNINQRKSKQIREQSETQMEASRKLHAAAIRIKDEKEEANNRMLKLQRQLNNLLAGVITPLGGIKSIMRTGDDEEPFVVLMFNGDKMSIAELVDSVTR